MRVPLVTLIVCATPVPAVVFVNGMLMGQVSTQESLPLPLSATGDYFITLHPLWSGYLPITRRLTFTEGEPAPPQGGDIQLYCWPEGICELELCPPQLCPPPAPLYPYLLSRLNLNNGRTAALYVENGLCFVVEEGWRVLYGTRLNGGNQGRLAQHNGVILAMADRTSQEDAVLVALSSDWKELLRLSGDSVDVQQGVAQAIKRLPTLLGHERREQARLRDGAITKEPPVFGFFTHELVQPMPGLQTAQALFEAVRYGFFEEARQYLTPDLSSQLSDGDLQEFFSGCKQARLSPEDSSQQGNSSYVTLGLTQQKADGLYQVRPFQFRLQNGLIDDADDGSEEENA